MKAQTRWNLALLIVPILFIVACGGGSEAPAETKATGETPPAEPEKPAVAAGDPAPKGTSTVAGVVKYEGPVPKLKPLKMDADPGCAKKHSGPVENESLMLGDGQALGNVFVRVKSGIPSGTYAPPAETVTLDQNGCQYTPHVVGVMTGQTFTVLNSDGLLHNVHSLSKTNKSFNRAMPANVTEASYTFDKEEVMFKVKCDVHPWMGAWVGVLPHPYFDVTGADGSYELAGLPAGTYELEFWHEKLGSKAESVTLGDGEAQSVDLTFTK